MDFSKLTLGMLIKTLGLPTIAGFFWGVYTYHVNVLATKDELENKVRALQTEVFQKDLDSRIGITEATVLFYQSQGIETLGDTAKGRYERAQARLINLERQRDEALGVPNG